MQNPYKYAKAVFEPPKCSILKIARENLESYLRATYDDAGVTMPGPKEDIKVRQHPTMALTMKPPTIREVEDYLKHCQNKFAPGPNGVHYVMCKGCPLFRAYLLQMLHPAWQARTIVDEWQIAEGIYIPKEKEAKHLVSSDLKTLECRKQDTLCDNGQSIEYLPN